MILRGSAALAVAALLSSCVSSPPRDVADVCSIFEDRRSWYKAAKSTEERWGVPVPVSMAFVYHESSFHSRAKPPRTKILWIIPGPRPSSAFGYAQALDTTWSDYEGTIGERARRNNFGDAIDFIGWYNANSYRMNNIPQHDAANLYLAYHEGNGGYSRATYADKAWLVSKANQVQETASRFQYQYEGCRVELEKNWFLRLFS
ncbi:MAG: hypothetical protein WDZ76_08040 [Pseudohongiellaceae bacterium]